MTAPPAEWRGTPEELAEFLSGARFGCAACGANRTFKSPCKEHSADAILATYSQPELDLLLGEKRDPFWRMRWGRGEDKPRLEPRTYTPRKES